MKPNPPPRRRDDVKASTARSMKSTNPAHDSHESLPATDKKPRPAPKSALVGLQKDAASALVVDSVTRARYWLESRYRPEDLSIGLLNQTFPTVPILIKAYIDEHYGEATALEQHAARRTVYELAHMPSRRPNYYRTMDLEEIVGYVQDHGWSRFSELPTKLAQRIDDAGWRDDVTERVPFDALILDARGRRCDSRYELTVRNILYDLDIEFRVNSRYPHHVAWNPNARKTLDLLIVKPDVPVEIWQYRCDTPLAGWGANANGFQRSVRSYVKARREKEAMQAEWSRSVISVEVTGTDHKAKVLSQFAFDFIEQLAVVVPIASEFKQPAWVAQNWRRWSTSKVFPESRAATQAAVLLKLAAAQLKIPRGVDWCLIADAVHDGLSLKEAAMKAGVPDRALEGICRLSTQKAWQYTATHDGSRSTLCDSTAGRGSCLLSLAVAMGRKARDVRREASRLERLPASLRNTVTGCVRIGKMGVFGATYRPGRYGHFVGLVNRGEVDGGGICSKSIRRRGARQAASAFLKKLSEAFGKVLLLDRPLRRSFRLFERSRASKVWVLLEPTEAEIHLLADRICRRLGLR